MHRSTASLRKYSIIMLYLIFLPIFQTTLANGQSSKASSDREVRAEMIGIARLMYSSSKDYSPYSRDVHTCLKQAQAFLNDSKFDEAIAEADRGLKFDKFNVELLVIKSASFRAMGRIEDADMSRQQWIAVIDSILSSGDGRGFSTAFKVISVDEEYAVLNIKGFQMIKQSLVKHEESEFDILVAKNLKSGEESEFYFNIDIPKKWLAKSLNLPSEITDQDKLKKSSTETETTLTVAPPSSQPQQ
jgi:hypothetical protein